MLSGSNLRIDQALVPSIRRPFIISSHVCFLFLLRLTLVNCVYHLTVRCRKIKLKHAEEPPSRNSGHFDVSGIAPPLTKRKVLLVEDNKMNQAIISKLLEMHCYEVTTADNGKEAVKSIQSANFDVVLMDFQMPVMDGITATKKIRELKIMTPIIGLTANADEFAQQESTAAGMCGLIMKPVKGNELKTKIEKTLDELAEKAGSSGPS